LRFGRETAGGYIGHVGTDFNHEALKELHGKLIE
jgi:hypothetical protein